MGSDSAAGKGGRLSVSVGIADDALDVGVMRGCLREQLCSVVLRHAKLQRAPLGKLLIQYLTPNIQHALITRCGEFISTSTVRDLEIFPDRGCGHMWETNLQKLFQVIPNATAHPGP